jgi:hypothetical protein
MEIEPESEGSGFLKYRCLTKGLAKDLVKFRLESICEPKIGWIEYQTKSEEITVYNKAVYRLASHQVVLPTQSPGQLNASVDNKHTVVVLGCIYWKSVHLRTAAE